jgi:hypothetical protein
VLTGLVSILVVTIPAPARAWHRWCVVGWAYDIVTARTHDGRAFRASIIVDEFTRECLSVDVAWQLSGNDVLERSAWLFVTRAVPDHIRSHNGPEFTAKAVRH